MLQLCGALIPYIYRELWNDEELLFTYAMLRLVAAGAAGLSYLERGSLDMNFEALAKTEGGGRCGFCR